MNHKIKFKATIALMLLPFSAMAYDSGSTGANGAFNPLVDTELQLPADGVFNYTTVNIPAGVTVTFAKNALNTPVTILASGDVTVSGVLAVTGQHAANSGTSGDGNIGDDGIPGLGGPGGFDGGSGGQPGSTFAERRGGNGLGPGGGISEGGNIFDNVNGCSGTGGGYASAGGTSQCWTPSFRTIPAGTSYGSLALLPLIGGSGGGGASAGNTFAGSGGGGGGGAILIASSGTVSVSGTIIARGGNGGSTGGAGRGGEGGGGSGGAIRIIATTIAGNGSINALGGTDAGGGGTNGGDGSAGRIRLEAENMLRTAATTPTFSFAGPGDAFIANMPSIRITRVAGVDAPAAPTGNADIVLPESTPNPVTIEFESTNIPVGNTIALSVVPNNASPINTLSNALSGTDQLATASATVTLPTGPSTLQATLSYTVTASVGEALSNFAMGETVERVEVAASMTGESLTTFITASGKAYTWPSNAVAFN